jgi:ABC-type transport system substrate-binding protein
MVLRIVPEDSTRIAMLKTGEIDVAHNITVDAAADIEKVGLRTVVARNSEIVFFPFGGMLLPEDKRYVEGYHQKDPWKNIKVREAMNIAIDRPTLVKTLYRGTATAAPIWVPLPGWDKLEPIPFDPKRAKQLLIEAGYPNGFGFKILTHTKRPELPLIAQAVASYWGEIGIKAEIVPGDYAAWRETNKTGKTAGWLWTHVLGDFPDWSERLSGYDLPGASTPLWSSEETKIGIKKVQSEIDPQKREALLKELARTYRALYAYVPIAYVPMLHGVSKKIGEWNPGHTLHPKNFVFARHSKPLNTRRLFTP